MHLARLFKCFMALSHQLTKYTFANIKWTLFTAPMVLKLSRCAAYSSYTCLPVAWWSQWSTSIENSSARVSIRLLCTRTMVALNCLSYYYHSFIGWAQLFSLRLVCGFCERNKHSTRTIRTTCRWDAFYCSCIRFDLVSCLLQHWFCGLFCEIPIHQVEDHVANATNAIINKCKSCNETLSVSRVKQFAACDM